MNAQTITTIVGIVVAAIEAAVQSGKAFREALADSLAEAAEKIRDGRINVDAAVDRAREDQGLIEGLYKRKGGDA